MDLEVPLDGLGGLVRVARALGEAGVGLEGGGMWGEVAHYLVADGDAALAALEGAGITGARTRAALLVELDADVPGALGRLLARLEDAGVDLWAQYSDHQNRKVLVVDDPDRARRVLEAGS